MEGSLVKYQVMRDLTDEEYSELRGSIIRSGVLVPIVFDEYENIIDGHHRKKVCDELGISNFPKQIIPKLSENEKMLMARQLNEARRQLTVEEKEREARRRLKENPELSDRQIAKQIGASNVYVSSVRKAMEQSGEVLAVNTTMGVDGKKYPRKPISVFNPSEREEKALQKPGVLERIQQGLTVDKALQELKKEQRQQEIQAQIKPSEASESVDIHNCQKKYRVVYADPPWAYNDACESGGIQARGASGVYPTMSLGEICELPIKNITADDAVLFLWVTSPLLEDSFKVISAWGFAYKSSFVWDKVKHNMGHYNSVRHEFLLIATKGRCTPDKVQLFDSVQSIERTEHSKKPQEFRNILETLYPYGERIELFSRDKPDGWDVMGNMV